MNIKEMLQAAWKWITGQSQQTAEQANDLLNQAMQTGENSQSVDNVLDVIESVGKSRGLDIGGYSNIMQGFRGKKPDEILPHVQKLMGTELFKDAISAFLGGKPK